MAETTTQTSKPQTLNHPLPPLKLFQQTFCKHCEIQCDISEERFRNCVLSLIADQLTHQRQLLQQRTQHLSW